MISNYLIKSLEKLPEELSFLKKRGVQFHVSNHKPPAGKSNLIPPVVGVLKIENY